MKKLKFLLLPLISLLFIINVNASVTYDVSYSEDIKNFIEDNKELLQKFDEWLNNLGYIDVCNNLGNCTSYYLNDDYYYYLDVSKYNDTKHFQVVGSPVRNQVSNSSLSLTINQYYTQLYINNRYSVSGEVIYNEENNTFSWATSNYQYSNYVNENTFSIINLIDNVFQIQYIFNNSHSISSQYYYNFKVYDDNNGSSLKIGNNIYKNNDSIYINDFIDYLNSSLIPPEPPIMYCDPNDYLGQISNVSDFTITIKGTTNSLSEKITGSFDIISNKTMSENDWQLSFEHTPDDIISTGSLSCIANRCVFHFLASVEDDIDEDVVLKYKFTSSSMPTKIQIDTCSNNNLDLNFSYTYTNNNTNTNTNTDNTIITDDSNMNNFMQDGSLPDYSDLSDTNIIPNGPVDAILTLPLNIMNNLLNVLNSNSCQPLVLPIPFTGGQNLTLPCISTLYQKIDGLPTFLNWFSAIFSAFILYQYFINLYRWVDDTLTFRENNHFGGY